MRNWVLTILTAALLAACSGGGGESAEVAVPTVVTDTLRLSGSGSLAQFPGRVKAATDANLSFRVAGVVEKIYVEEGSYVRAGQLVAELDSTDYRTRLDATEAEYLQVEAQAGRVLALYEEDGTTPSERDKAVYGLRQITAKLQAHRDQLGYTRLYAPFGGRVQSKLVSEHEAVSAGMPILTVITDNALEVEIHLSAADHMRLGSMSRYTCSFDVISGVEFPLEPIWTSPQANANQLYTMRLRVKNVAGAPAPAPGMSTIVTAVVAGDGGRLTFQAPGGAVFEDSGRTWVYVYDPATSTVSRREVEVERLLLNEDVVISSAELSAGDVIVASGVHKLRDGAQAKPLEPVSQTNVGGLL